MATGMPQRPNGQDRVLLTFDADIGDLNLAKEATHVAPAKDVFDSAIVLLTMIRVGFFNSVLQLGRFPTNVHRTRGSRETTVLS